jgi:hypothetical protein
MKQLEDLQQNLTESGALLRTYENIIAERENLLKDLQTRLSEMSAIYRASAFTLRTVPHTGNPNPGRHASCGVWR